MHRQIFSFVLGSLLLIAQQRFPDGEMKGFTEPVGGATIVREERPFVVHKVEGVVLRSAGDKSPIRDALFELRGPGNAVTIRSVKTDANGKFRLVNVPAGKYMFMVNSLGFRSIVGVIIMSPSARDISRIRLSMYPGI